MMHTTRREVIQAGAAGTAAAWLASSPAAAFAQPSAAGDVPAYLSRGAYRPGDELRLPSATLRVDEVADLANAQERGLAGSDLAFAVLLSGVAGTPLEQGTHKIGFRDGSAGELFLVPVGRTEGRYEVVVDRSVRLAAAPGPANPPAEGAPVAATPPVAAGDEPALKPEARYAFLKSVSVRRGRPGLRAQVRLAKGSRLKRVSVKVMRDGVVLARGGADVGNNRALVGLRMLAPVRRGSRYDIVVTGVDRAGHRTVVRRSGIVH
jgi:hypothetical protein